MSGYISRDGSTNKRLDRIDALLAQMIPLLPPETFTEEVRALAEDLLSEDADRQERARRRLAQMEAAAPATASEGDQ